MLPVSELNRLRRAAVDELLRSSAGHSARLILMELLSTLRSNIVDGRETELRLGSGERNLGGAKGCAATE